MQYTKLSETKHWGTAVAAALTVGLVAAPGLAAPSWWGDGGQDKGVRAILGKCTSCHIPTQNQNLNACVDWVGDTEMGCTGVPFGGDLSSYSAVKEGQQGSGANNIDLIIAAIERYTDGDVPPSNSNTGENTGGSGQDHTFEMPPEGFGLEPVSAEELTILQTWANGNRDAGVEDVDNYIATWEDELNGSGVPIRTGVKSILGNCLGCHKELESHNGENLCYCKKKPEKSGLPAWLDFTDPATLKAPSYYTAGQLKIQSIIERGGDGSMPPNGHHYEATQGSATPAGMRWFTDIEIDVLNAWITAGMLP